MHEFEQPLWDLGYNHVVGIDEAGRGPIAGPLVVAAVILPVNYDHPIINDSKKLSVKKRDLLFDVIVQEAVAYTVVIVEPEQIDQLNIYQATKQAMQQCVENLMLTCDVNHALTDAMPIPFEPHTSIIKGDARSISIAAASILAKVTRDRLMIEYDALYPEYEFKQHKGYPTKKHFEALKLHGICPIHRHSFEPVKSMLID